MAQSSRACAEGALPRSGGRVPTGLAITRAEAHKRADPLKYSDAIGTVRRTQPAP